MSTEFPDQNLRLSKSFINLQGIMESEGGRARKMTTSSEMEYDHNFPGKTINKRPLSRENSRRLFSASYFSWESMLLLLCLTASLLILPLILPPLPPPPFMLLLLPICILAVLMILALKPSNSRDLTYTYV